MSLFENGVSVNDELASFTLGIVTELASENGRVDEEVVNSAFEPILDIIHKETANHNILTFHQYWFEMLQKFSSVEALAKLVIRHSTPKNNNGRAYSDTLLGALLTLSCLPKTVDAPFDFFDKPLQQVLQFFIIFHKDLRN